MKQKISHAADVAAGYPNQLPWVDQLAEKLMQRFDWLKLQPERILCLGATSQRVLTELFERFPQAQIYLADFSSARMQAITDTMSFPITQLHMTPDTLPLADQAVDLIVSHCVLQWCELLKLIPELFRILATEGLLMFTTLGSASLQEIRQAWAFDVGYQHVNDFTDMHDMGDLLLKHRFIDPVMDMEMYQVCYSDIRQIIQDLKQLGSCNIHPHRRRGLMGKAVFDCFMQAYQQLTDEHGKLPLSWEIVYGHAWMPKRKLSVADAYTQEVAIPVTAIGKSTGSNNDDESNSQ
jgi:malonyl-CoA O-methyltransferase